MRGNAVTSAETSSPATILPHLKGARPTIHAGLLRPVLLNRTRSGGHPGAPPPAHSGKKRRKQQEHRHRSHGAQEERTPQTNASSENIHFKDMRSRVWRKRREQYHAKNTGGSSGNKSHTSQRTCDTDENFHGSMRVDFSRTPDPPCRPVHPASSPCGAHAGFTMMLGGGEGWREVDDVRRPTHRAEGDIVHKKDPRRRRVEGYTVSTDATDARCQMIVGERPPFAASPAEVNPLADKRKATLLPFRASTRDEVNRPDSRQPTTASTRTSRTMKTLGTSKSDQVRSARARPHLKARRTRRRTHDARATHDVKNIPSPFPPPSNLEAGGDGLAGEKPSGLLAAAHGRASVTEGGDRRRGIGDEAQPQCDSNIPGRRQMNQGGKDGNNHNNNNNNNNNNSSSSSSSGNGSSGASASTSSTSRRSVPDTLPAGWDAASSCCAPVNTTPHHVARCTCESCRRGRSKRIPGPPAWPTVKFVGAVPRLVSATLQAQHFRRHQLGRATRGGAWRLLWSSQHLRSHVFRNLKRGQRINSFPRTYECTRKDALSRNMNRMGQVHGERHFSFAPRGFVLPAEREAVREAMLDTSEGETWIVKPANSACGRGIFITKKFTDLPAGTGSEGNWIAQRYVENPLLLDGLKFDLRLYVLVTCFRPLRVYMHQEGLCRLATEPYTSDAKSFGNRFIHLTNYSINRKSSRYEPGTMGGGDEDEEDGINPGSTDSRAKASPKLCLPKDCSEEEKRTIPGKSLAESTITDETSPCRATSRTIVSGINATDPVAANACAASAEVGRTDQEEEKRTGTSSPTKGTGVRFRGGTGSKWSLKALRKRLTAMGVDVPALWGGIHDLCIKTLIAIEAQVSAAVELLGIRRGTCFELFGFDVMVDQQQTPHLLEVNFAPSLNTDSDLDLAVKSKVVADVLTLAGILGSSGMRRPSSRMAATNAGTAKSHERIDLRKHIISRRSGNDDSIPSTGHKDENDRGADGAGMVPGGGERPVTPRTCQTPTERNMQRGASGGRDGQEGKGNVRRTETGARNDFSEKASRPMTNEIERMRPKEPASWQNVVGGRSRGAENGVGSQTSAPAWEGSFRFGEGKSPSAEEMASMVLDSESELRRSGGFELIFPVASTAHKYFRFFDGPRPLERMLANATPASEKAAVARVWRRRFEKRASKSEAASNRHEAPVT